MLLFGVTCYEAITISQDFKTRGDDSCGLIIWRGGHALADRRIRPCHEPNAKSVRRDNHVMLRGINRQLIFEEPEDYSKVLSNVFVAYFNVFRYNLQYEY